MNTSPMFGLLVVVGFLLAAFYVIISFLLPIFVWHCRNRLGRIIDELRDIRQELKAQNERPDQRISSGDSQLTKNAPPLFSDESVDDYFKNRKRLDE